jgi:hypothetical protein
MEFPPLYSANAKPNLSYSGPGADQSIRGAMAACRDFETVACHASTPAFLQQRLMSY